MTFPRIAPAARVTPVLRIALAVLLAGCVSVLTAAPAFAHTELKSSSPGDGASLDTAPDTVTLTFEEAVTLPANPISVTGPDGVSWTVGTPTITGASVTAPVQATGPAGRYTLNYTVTADDGDAVKGTVAFTLAAPATPTAAGTAVPTAATVATAEATAGVPTSAPVTEATGSDTGTSTWVWVAVAVVVLGLGAALATLVARRRSGAGRG